MDGAVPPGGAASGAQHFTGGDKNLPFVPKYFDRFDSSHAVLAICGVFTAIFTRAGGFMRAAAGTATAGTAPATRRSRSGDCACSGERCAYFMVISMLVCPMYSCTRRTFTPAMVRRDAKV